MSKKLGLTFILLIFANFSLALECPSNFGAKEIAFEILKLELSGARVDGMADHKCMKQKNHPYVKAVSDPSNEEGSEPKHYMKRKLKKSDIKVNVQLLDSDTHTYNADFILPIKDKKVKTSFQFFLYKGSKNQKRYGCGAALSAPEEIILFEDCRL